jgi:nitrite reductase/ring-hydroxylating ferredoxin subunit
LNDPPPWQPLEIVAAETAFPARAECAGVPIWVFKAGPAYRGTQDTCPHDDRSLATARIVRDGTMVRCAYHNYTFKHATGSGVNCPGFHITVYDVEERDGRLFARPTVA